MLPDELNKLVDIVEGESMNFSLSKFGSSEEQKALDKLWAAKEKIKEEYAKLFKEVGELKHE